LKGASSSVAASICCHATVACFKLFLSHAAPVLPVLVQGYRTVSDKVWTIGQTSREGDLIATIIDPEPGPLSALSSSDDDGEAGSSSSGGHEVVPLLAVYELLMSAGFDPEGAAAGAMM
jgi:hypothetical protein